MTISVNDIIDGVTIALNNEFGDNYKIYPQHIKQNLSTPCFIVYVVQSSEQRVIGNRYKLEVPFRIKYVGDDEGYHKTDNDIGLRMYDCLEIIDLLNGDKLVGRNLKYNYDDDGHLTFDVIYKLHIIKLPNEIEDIDMESLSSETDVRG